VHLTSHSWLPFFSGEEVSGNLHWDNFCNGFDWYMVGQSHLDVFMKLFASSLIGQAKGWINTLPKRSIKDVQELQKVFRARWCVEENLHESFLQYTEICKGPGEDLREFSDRFNLFLKKVGSKVGSEEAIIARFLSSLEGSLHFNVKDRSPTTLEEAQDLAFEVERNLDFDDYIQQRNLNCEVWDSGDEPMAEPEDPSILQVELAPTKRKWSLSHESVISSQEPLLKRAHPEDEVVDKSYKNVDPSLPEDFSLFIHQVGDPVSKHCDFRPFFVSLQVNGFLLHNCLLHPGAKANIMTGEVMERLGLKVSLSNTTDNFFKGVINDLEVAFDSCPCAPFLMDVFVVIDINNFGIILCDELIAHLDGSIRREQSRAVVPHPEGGFFIIYNEPFVGSVVEDLDEVDDQLLCINSGLDDWFIQEGKLDMDTVEET
jgi:hypothetical protein